MCVASVRDTETQEASLVAQFADALHPAAMPWDVFIEGPMPERASMSIRQPLLRNGFGSLVFATRNVNKAKHKFLGLLKKKRQKNMKQIFTIDQCQRRRSSAVLPGCVEQKALARWFFTLLRKCFQSWKRSSRLSSWARKRPDPYSTYSVMLEAGGDAAASDNWRDEMEEEGGEEGWVKEEERRSGGDENVDALEMIQKQTIGMVQTQSKGDDNKSSAAERNESNQESDDTTRPKTRDEEDKWTTSLSDSMFEEAAAFVDTLIQTRRNSVKRGCHVEGEDGRASLFGMTPQMLLSLRVKFLHRQKREADERDKSEQEASRHDGDPLAFSSCTKAVAPEQTWEEKTAEFFSFVVSSGCFSDQSRPVPSTTSSVAGKRRRRRSGSGSRSRSGSAESTGTDINRATSAGRSLRKTRGSARRVVTALSQRIPPCQHRPSTEPNKIEDNKTRRRSFQNKHRKTYMRIRTCAVVPRRPPTARCLLSKLHLAQTQQHVGAQQQQQQQQQQRPTTFRVLLVDDSKPFRIRLASLLRRTFASIDIATCGTPEAGMNMVVSSPHDTPIHMVIVDQVFMGTDTTGKEMCEDLTIRAVSEELVYPPCVLISGSVELSREEKKSSVSSTIVECCRKRDITRDVILKWFAAYVNVRVGVGIDDKWVVPNPPPNNKTKA